MQVSRPELPLTEALGNIQMGSEQPALNRAKQQDCGFAGDGQPGTAHQLFGPLPGEARAVAQVAQSGSCQALKHFSRA
ncbi:MAG: hypothetical protein B7Y42_01645 [Polaromonas sp. 28-63-22]|nr:MAG: hypothetical protein B7Y42_01645 [Polaromonas sp. 28-63-22]